MYAPAAAELVAEFGVNDSVVAAFTVSIYSKSVERPSPLFPSTPVRTPWPRSLPVNRGRNINRLTNYVVLGMAIGPLAIAPLSEHYGRLVVIHVCNLVFVVFLLACALSTST